MRIGHNLASYNIFVSYKSALVGESKAMADISSGLKINSSADDPYNSARVENFDMQLRNLQRTSQNSQDAVNLIQTAEGGLSNISDMLQRINELAVQNSNGTYNTENRADSQDEVNQLIQGITNIAKSTNMNGVNLLSSTSGTPVQAKIGGNIGENLSIPTFDIESSKLIDTSSGKAVSDIDLTTQDGCKEAINTITAALQTVNAARDQYGAIENRLNENISNSSDIGIQVQTGQSDIQDADIASEMMDYSKQSIIVQAGIAMMAQSNKFPQEVLSILQNVKS